MLLMFGSAALIITWAAGGLVIYWEMIFYVEIS